MLVALAAHEQYIVSGKKDREAQHLTDESFQETIRLLADGEGLSQRPGVRSHMPTLVGRHLEVEDGPDVVPVDRVQFHHGRGQ